MKLTLPRNAHVWLPGYVRSRLRNGRVRGTASRPRHVLLCIADHYEPNNGHASPAQQQARVERWAMEYPAMASAFRDADGRPPQHTFFFPAEAYEPAHLDVLSAICRQGFGEVEVHLHHGHDTSFGVRQRLETFTSILATRHGLLSRHEDGRIAYAFIHGNWALDNGGADASTCGVNDELTVLRETGCYADFTMPACPNVAQSRVVNAIYYVRDDPQAPRSYDTGIRARVGRAPDADELLLIQGPLRVWLENPLRRLVPRVDSGTLDSSPGNRPTIERFGRWMDAGVRVDGQPDWVFIKVHTHGAPEHNAAVLLGRDMSEFHRQLAEQFRDRDSCRLHYVTAREMYNIVKAAEAGKTGDPGQYRDFSIRRIVEATDAAT